MSDVIDGTMSYQIGDNDSYLNNRVVFLEQHQVLPADTVLVRLRYQGENYCRYKTVSRKDAGDGITSPSSSVVDSLFTCQPQLGLFLPLADCIGAVLYDQAQGVFGLAHLGRHNLVQFGGLKNIEYMQRQFDSKPENITVNLSAAAGKEAYPLHDFDNRSLHEVAIEQLLQAGISRASIAVDERDTTRDLLLFSHSNFLQGSQKSDGRHALVAIMR